MRGALFGVYLPEQPPSKDMSKETDTMARCERCGNDYSRPITVTRDGGTHTYDSFEYAIHASAPTWEHCGIHILGHGIGSADHLYCGAHCNRGAGADDLVDHL